MKIVKGGKLVEFNFPVTVPLFKGATTTTEGEQGLVPSPKTTDKDKFLKGDGKWSSINEVTITQSGLMSSKDKNKLDNISEGANKTIIDTSLNASSVNPVQNKAITNAINKCISKNPTVIPREADLNTILETGYYSCSANDTAKTIKNCPIQEAFYLEVVKNQESSNSSQLYTQFKQILTSFNINNPKTFIRTSVNHSGTITFSAWQEFVFSQNAIKSITANNNVLTYTTANARTQTVTIDNVPNAIHAQSSGKLTTPRSISVGGAVKSNAVNFDGTQNITILANTIYEPFIDYGYSHITGRTSPIDNAMSALHSANRFQFAMPSGITIEYSTDGGKTWLDYGTSDTCKMKLVCDLGESFYIGKRTSKNTINDKLRITLNASKMGVYTRFRKILLNISTGYATGSNVTIERSLKGTPTVFTKYGEGSIPISGWSGWNSLNMGGILFGGSVGQNSNYECIRLTFGITGVNSDSSKSSALAINNILGFGDTYWATPSTMAKTGNIYTYDVNQNVDFPATVSARLFDGLATKAQKDSREQVIDSTYIKGLSANGRTITVTKGDGTTSTITTQDTVYSHPTNHPATMITGLANVAKTGSYNDLANKPTTVVTVSALNDIKSKSNGYYKFTGTIATISGSWIIFKIDSLYQCTNIENPRYMFNSNNLTDFYSPYGSWHA